IGREIEEERYHGFGAGDSDAGSRRILKHGVADLLESTFATPGTLCGPGGAGADVGPPRWEGPRYEAFWSAAIQNPPRYRSGESQRARSPLRSSDPSTGTRSAAAAGIRMRTPREATRRAPGGASAPIDQGASKRV